MTRPPEHLYPFESHYFETRGLRMHYLDEGPRDAPPVLMLLHADGAKLAAAPAGWSYCRLHPWIHGVNFYLAMKARR